jgi:hypothetical protein
MTHDYKYPEEWREMEFEKIWKQAKERMKKRRVEWMLDEAVRKTSKLNFLGREV